MVQGNTVSALGPYKGLKQVSAVGGRERGKAEEKRGGKGRRGMGWGGKEEWVRSVPQYPVMSLIHK